MNDTLIIDECEQKMKILQKYIDKTDDSCTELRENRNENMKKHKIKKERDKKKSNKIYQELHNNNIYKFIIYSNEYYDNITLLTLSPSSSLFSLFIEPLPISLRPNTSDLLSQDIYMALSKNIDYNEFNKKFNINIYDIYNVRDDINLSTSENSNENKNNNEIIKFDKDNGTFINNSISKYEQYSKNNFLIKNTDENNNSDIKIGARMLAMINNNVLKIEDVINKKDSTKNKKENNYFIGYNNNSDSENDDIQEYDENDFNFSSTEASSEPKIIYAFEAFPCAQTNITLSNENEDASVALANKISVNKAFDSNDANNLNYKQKKAERLREILDISIDDKTEKKDIDKEINDIYFNANISFDSEEVDKELYEMQDDE